MGTTFLFTRLLVIIGVFVTKEINLSASEKIECFPKLENNSQKWCTNTTSCDKICKGDGNDGGYCSKNAERAQICYCYGCKISTRQGECLPKLNAHSQTRCTSTPDCNTICKGDGNFGGYCAHVQNTGSHCFCHDCYASRKEGECRSKDNKVANSYCPSTPVCNTACRKDGNASGFCSRTIYGYGTSCYCQGCLSKSFKTFNKSSGKTARVIRIHASVYSFGLLDNRDSMRIVHEELIAPAIIIHDGEGEITREVSLNKIITNTINITRTVTMEAVDNMSAEKTSLDELKSSLQHFFLGPSKFNEATSNKLVTSISQAFIAAHTFTQQNQNTKSRTFSLEIPENLSFVEKVLVKSDSPKNISFALNVLEIVSIEYFLLLKITATSNGLKLSTSEISRYLGSLCSIGTIGANTVLVNSTGFFEARIGLGTSTKIEQNHGWLMEYILQNKITVALYSLIGIAVIFFVGLNTYLKFGNRFCPHHEYSRPGSNNLDINPEISYTCMECSGGGLLRFLC